MSFIRNLILKWIKVVILRNPHGKSSLCRKEASSPHAQRQYHNQAQLNLNKYISATSTSEASSCPEAALPAAFEAIMRAVRSSNLQMFSTYRRVNQLRYLATKPHIIKNTTQYGCKPMVLIKMVVVVLDKCGWRSIELLARIRIMRSMQFMHCIV